MSADHNSTAHSFTAVSDNHPADDIEEKWLVHAPASSTIADLALDAYNADAGEERNLQFDDSTPNDEALADSGATTAPVGATKKLTREDYFGMQVAEFLRELPSRQRSAAMARLQLFMCEIESEVQYGQPPLAGLQSTTPKC